jgi:hypothetical protein
MKLLNLFSVQVVCDEVMCDLEAGRTSERGFIEVGFLAVRAAGSSRFKDRRIIKNRMPARELVKSAVTTFVSLRLRLIPPYTLVGSAVAFWKGTVVLFVVHFGDEVAFGLPLTLRKWNGL